MRLNGVETKHHPIFTELARVKQYFDKIQKVENPAAERESKLNTEVAARFIRSDLVSGLQPHHLLGSVCSSSSRVTTSKSTPS